jgi:hypothetical protein
MPGARSVMQFVDLKHAQRWLIVVPGHQSKPVRRCQRPQRSRVCQPPARRNRSRRSGTERLAKRVNGASGTLRLGFACEADRSGLRYPGTINPAGVSGGSVLADGRLDLV